MIRPGLGDLSIVGALLVGLLSPSASLAGDTDWEVKVAPYAWGISLTGDATVDDTTVDVDTSFKDILSKLNAAFFGTVEARRGRFLLYLDAFGSVLEDDFDTGATTVGFGPTTVSDGPLSVAIPRVEAQVGPVDGETKTTLWGVELFGGYRLVSRSVSELLGEGVDDDPRRFHVDLLAGARYWNIDQELELTIPPVEVPGFDLSGAVSSPIGDVRFSGVRVPGVELGGTDIDTSFETDWVDPTVGIRIESDVSRRWKLWFLGGVGGFGIGSASNFAWQAALFANYRMRERWEFQVGYGALGIDNDLGSNANVDLIMHGPVFGVVYRFGPLPDIVTAGSP